jgi:GNAT superfamily N-acetyltransferase
MNAEQAERAAAIMQTDRAWCAYALADLDPVRRRYGSWLVGPNSLVLLYCGLEPPVLFAHGDPTTVADLLAQMPAGRLQFTLLGTHRAALGQRLAPEHESKMWRMVLKGRPAGPAPDSTGGTLALLGPDDLEEIEALFAGHPDRPDAYDPSQLADRTFFGLRLEGELVSIAGTHVVSRPSSVAAVGNVFTRPDQRGRGFARRVTSGVLDSLRNCGIKTIVLNVDMENAPAIACYRNLGFWPFCGYYEGAGLLR